MENIYKKFRFCTLEELFFGTCFPYPCPPPLPKISVSIRFTIPNGANLKIIFIHIICVCNVRLFHCKHICLRVFNSVQWTLNLGSMPHWADSTSEIGCRQRSHSNTRQPFGLSHAHRSEAEKGNARLFIDAPSIYFLLFFLIFCSWTDQNFFDIFDHKRQ
jgi:hypothetical protein